MDQRVLSLITAASRPEFRRLTTDLRELMPYRDGSGRLQFRVLRLGEQPLNRRARRYIARRLITGGAGAT